MQYEFTIKTIPEYEKDGYIYCGKCDTKLIVVSPFEDWAVDSEAFKNGEQKPDEVFVGEIVGHFCTNCDQLTSLSYNH